MRKILALFVSALIILSACAPAAATAPIVIEQVPVTAATATFQPELVPVPATPTKSEPTVASNPTSDLTCDLPSGVWTDFSSKKLYTPLPLSTDPNQPQQLVLYASNQKLVSQLVRGNGTQDEPKIVSDIIPGVVIEYTFQIRIDKKTYEGRFEVTRCGEQDFIRDVGGQEGPQIPGGHQT